MEFYETTPTHDLTYSDVFLVPRHSDVGSRLGVSLAPEDGTGATIPIVSANMNSVTGPRLAATLARRGGLAVLPQDLHLQDLDAAIRWVKAQPVAFDTPLFLSDGQTVAEALRQFMAKGIGIYLCQHIDHLESLPLKQRTSGYRFAVDRQYLCMGHGIR